MFTPKLSRQLDRMYRPGPQRQPGNGQTIYRASLTDEGFVPLANPAAMTGTGRSRIRLPPQMKPAAGERLPRHRRADQSFSSKAPTWRRPTSRRTSIHLNRQTVNMQSTNSRSITDLKMVTTDIPHHDHGFVGLGRTLFPHRRDPHRRRLAQADPHASRPREARPYRSARRPRLEPPVPCSTPSPLRRPPPSRPERHRPGCRRWAPTNPDFDRCSENKMS